MRGGSRSVAAGAGLVLAGSLWLPWFTRRVSDLVAPLAADRSRSGWAALDELAFVLVVAAVASALWALNRLPAFWLVVAGALALMVEVAATVGQVDTGDQQVTTTSPAVGLLVAVAAATAIVLVGLLALLADVKRRAEAARAS